MSLTEDKINTVITTIQKMFGTTEFIPLHAPLFVGNEKKYLSDCIDSTFVSTVGEYVGRFEKMVAEFTGAKFAIATTNGTSALHAALILAGVDSNSEVLTQALTFVATANAISYCHARPVFIDSDKAHLGMSEKSLQEFLDRFAEMRSDGFCYNKLTGKKIKACVPMHTFGHPVKIDLIKEICQKYNIVLVEDSAESLGSYYKGVHTGLYGDLGILSFNGNKTITTGGGGMIITNNEELAKKAKHITTTAKIPHPFEFFHDEIGFNYRLPNVNAALGCAQMENLPRFLEDKRKTANEYVQLFESFGIYFVKEPVETKSNYWLNAILLDTKADRDLFLEKTNKAGVMTRPAWKLMNKLPAFKECQFVDLSVAQDISDRLVNIPSSVRIK